MVPHGVYTASRTGVSPISIWAGEKLPVYHLRGFLSAAVVRGFSCLPWELQGKPLGIGLWLWKRTKRCRNTTAASKQRRGGMGGVWDGRWIPSSGDCCKDSPQHPPSSTLSCTCADLHAGFFAHISQLNNHMVFASRFKFLNGVLHCAVPGFHFVDFICFSY